MDKFIGYFLMSILCLSVSSIQARPCSDYRKQMDKIRKFCTASREMEANQAKIIEADALREENV